jgi:hypothetical protein
MRFISKNVYVLFDFVGAAISFKMVFLKGLKTKIVHLSSFIIMYIPEKQIRTRFSKEDDILLISLVNEYGIGNWDLIREKFVSKAANQCRDR